jgi:hypothetical protein
LFTIVTAEDWTNTTTAEHGEGGHGELGSGKSHGSSDRGEGAADGGEREVDLSMDSTDPSMGKRKIERGAQSSTWRGPRTPRYQPGSARLFDSVKPSTALTKDGTRHAPMTAHRSTIISATATPRIHQVIPLCVHGEPQKHYATPKIHTEKKHQESDHLKQHVFAPC